MEFGYQTDLFASGPVHVPDVHRGLFIGECTYREAVYACENWHYSQVAPSAIQARYGVWEYGEFIGVIIFGVGINKYVADEFGLEHHLQCLELQRVALKAHENHVSRMLAVTRRLVKRKLPNLRVAVSYADPKEGHHGGIYQADGWTFIGKTGWKYYPVVDGVVIHPRTLVGLHGSTSRATIKEHYPDAQIIESPPKYRYAWGFDKDMRAKLWLMHKPYPRKRNARSLQWTRRDEHGIVPQACEA